MRTITILKVANGFIVSFGSDAYGRTNEECFAFESYESLEKWLRDYVTVKPT